MDACARQWQDFNPGKTFDGYRDWDSWWAKECDWGPWGGPAPTLVSYMCETGYKRVPTGLCIAPPAAHASRPCLKCWNRGGNLNPATDHPIDILTGTKAFEAVDFQTADGLLGLTRYFASMRGGGEDGSMLAMPLGMANWALGFGLELHLASTWNTNGRAGLSTPEGGHYRFVKSGSVMVAEVTSAYPLPSTDYTLEFVGTWPGTLSAVRTAKSSWIVRGPDDRIWRLETFLNPSTGLWDIARPVALVEPSGAELTLAYDGFGAVRSVTDSYGRRIGLNWVTIGDTPRAITSADLPDGTHIDYIYQTMSSAGAVPERLIRVERRDAGNNLLDKTTYQYGDTRYPFFVTAILDKNDVTRWAVTYDDAARATSSSGPSGTDASTVAYSAEGTSFSRTVTNALGEATTYNFTRPSTSTFAAKLVSVVGAATGSLPLRTTSMTYGVDKFLASATDAEGRITVYTRDSKGRSTQTVEAQGTAVARTTSVTWHATLNSPSQVTEPGLTTSFTFASASSSAYAPAYIATQAFAYTGAGQTYTVPAGASTATVELWGGAGGNGNGQTGAWSGAGGYVKATFAVSPGDVLTVEIAGGGQGGAQGANGGAGGWPDGGAGARGNNGSGGGGGSTRLYVNGALKAVAGGGGGSGGISSGNGGPAGAGGGTGGQAGDHSGGSGGTASAGGVDTSDPTNAAKTGRSIVSFPGAQRTGGWGGATGDNTTATSDDGGGGGGGYWGGGGGGGDGHPGGGGSSWIDSAAASPENLPGNRYIPAKTPPGQPTVATGVASASNGPAVAGGNGYAIIGVR